MTAPLVFQQAIGGLFMTQRTYRALSLALSLLLGGLALATCAAPESCPAIVDVEHKRG